MSNIILNVSYADKDEIKRLGAKWDAERKVWFLPKHVDQSAFSKWLPKEPEVTIRSSFYFLARSTEICWKCSSSTHVFGFVLPSGHAALEPGDGPDGWVLHNNEIGIPRYITYLAPAVTTLMKSVSRHYRTDFSNTTKSSYWMNHCEHCGAKQGDFQMFCEPGGAFFPMDKAEAAAIKLQKIAEPFDCSGDIGYDSFPFDLES